MIKLHDCCWVEVEGRARPQLVIRKKLKPAIYAVDAFLYWEDGSPVPTNADAPRIVALVVPRKVANGHW